MAPYIKGKAKVSPYTSVKPPSNETNKKSFRGLNVPNEECIRTEVAQTAKPLATSYRQIGKPPPQLWNFTDVINGS